VSGSADELVGEDARVADAAQAGFRGRLGWGEAPAVLVVDAMAAYVAQDSPMRLPEATSAVAAMARLVNDARRLQRAVIWTVVRYPRGTADAPLFFAKVPGLAAFTVGSPLGEICEGLTPLPGEPMIEKRYASAFFGTDLATQLRLLGVDTVVIGGFSTSGCVRASALDALQHGFRPIVVEQAVADRDPSTHRQNLFDLATKYADVVSLEEARVGLRGGSSAERRST